MWSQSLSCHADICHCSKPTCLISLLIYVVLDRVLSNSSRTRRSKCRCLSFKGLKTITKTIAAFLPDSSPGGNYFQSPKLGTRAAAGTSAEQYSRSSQTGPCSHPCVELCGSCAWWGQCQSTASQLPVTPQHTWRLGQRERERISSHFCPVISLW